MLNSSFLQSEDRQGVKTARIRNEIARYVERPFGVFADLFRMQMLADPEKIALVCADDAVSYSALDERAERIAWGLHAEGVGRGSVVAICASTSVTYVATFIGILRTGAAVSPVSPSATPEQLAAMVHDCNASHIFADALGSEALQPYDAAASPRRIAIETGSVGVPLDAWMPSRRDRLPSIEIDPEQPFDIIYSSGTTGTPKGIVQPHAMRWPQLHLLDPPGYGTEAVAIISTPLYSNTTLVSLLPALAGGGCTVLMPKFDARTFLELSEQHRVTVAMLVPVQYRRILDVPDFHRFDLSSYVVKYATSAPFSASLKREVLARWPGGLVEYYGMSEGGAACMLAAHERPDKLETVGRPIEGHEMLIIDEQGRLLPCGEMGEVVGRSTVMMTGYHNQPSKTAEAEWIAPDGSRFIRTGDIGKVDHEGFLTLIGRKKDIIISGGVNVYPVDLEQVLCRHPAVREAAVVGGPCRRWGETPIGFVTLNPGATLAPADLEAWANERLGKVQRLSEVHVVDELPRNAIGKVLKRDLQQLCGDRT